MMYHFREVTEWRKKLPHGTKQALICSALLSNDCYTLYLVDCGCFELDRKPNLSTIVTHCVSCGCNVFNETMIKHKPDNIN